jgi:hypothetical protein
MQELKMDDSGSQQCSILWPAKADSAQLKRWIKGPNQTSTSRDFRVWLVPNGFLWCSQCVFPSSQYVPKLFPTAPHFVPCLFLAQVSKQACLLAMYVCRWAKGEKNCINYSILRISLRCEFFKTTYNNVGE